MPLYRLVKSGVGKTWTAVDKMRHNEVGKESLKDMFLPVFKEKNLLEWQGNKALFCKV